MPALNSTHVAKAEYDAETQELEITFRTGEVGVYSSVPLWIYDGLINAIDPGTYVRNAVKGKFSYEKIAAA